MALSLGPHQYTRKRFDLRVIRYSFQFAFYPDWVLRVKSISLYLRFHSLPNVLRDSGNMLVGGRFLYSAVP